jgi:hypothetical protein
MSQLLMLEYALLLQAWLISKIVAREDVALVRA